MSRLVLSPRDLRRAPGNHELRVEIAAVLMWTKIRIDPIRVAEGPERRSKACRALVPARSRTTQRRCLPEAPDRHFRTRPSQRLGTDAAGSATSLHAVSAADEDSQEHPPTVTSETDGPLSGRMPARSGLAGRRDREPIARSAELCEHRAHRFRDTNRHELTHASAVRLTYRTRSNGPRSSATALVAEARDWQLQRLVEAASASTFRWVKTRNELREGVCQKLKAATSVSSAGGCFAPIA